MIWLAGFVAAGWLGTGIWWWPHDRGCDIRLSLRIWRAATWLPLTIAGWFR